MTGTFDSASSQYLSNAATPITTFPFSVGVWVYPTATGVEQTIFGISDTATTNNFWELFITTGDSFQVIAAAGGQTNGITLGTVTLNSWHFLLMRIISATNRRVTGLWTSGGFTVSSANGTQSRNASSIDMMTLGAERTTSVSRYFSGGIGEFWVTNTDVYWDSAAHPPDWFIHQLALRGPFAFPHIARNLMDYRSLRQSMGSNLDVFNDVLMPGIGGRQTWTNNGAVQLGPQPIYLNAYREQPNSIATRVYM